MYLLKFQRKDKQVRRDGGSWEWWSRRLFLLGIQVEFQGRPGLKIGRWLAKEEGNLGPLTPRCLEGQMHSLIEFLLYKDKGNNEVELLKFFIHKN